MNEHDFFYAVKVENLPEPAQMKDYFMSLVIYDTVPAPANMEFSTSNKIVL
ncbi:MAG: hypothetical protein ACYDG6_05355 [Thermincolia bacterium]